MARVSYTIKDKDGILTGMDAIDASEDGSLTSRGENPGQCQDRATCSSLHRVQRTGQRKAPSLGQHLRAEEDGILLTRRNDHPELEANTL